MARTVFIASVIRVILIAGIIGMVIVANAQSVAVNNNGAPANSSAMLDITSTTKGMLIPRMNSQQRGQIITPAEGLIVFDTDTKGFWYYSNNTWNEIPKSIGNGGGGIPTGPAGGDLSGSYPTPNVVKIQNLDVAFGVPLNKQVMKWDMLNNKWKGENDSLFLPYNATFGSPTKLFGITNTNITAGSTAVYGQNGNSSSGISVPVTSGVWGDNTNGAGVIGTSLNQNGVLGIGVNDHGIKGISTFTGKAGVYGKNDASNSFGIMGEIFSSGAAVYGKSTASPGKAAFFESTNAANTDTAVKILQQGSGAGLSVMASKGKAGVFSNSDVTANQTVVDITNIGTGSAASFITNNSANSTAAVKISNNGTGRGLESIVTNVANTNPAVYASSPNTYAIYALAKTTAVYGQATGLSGGIAINGLAGLNNSDGIGVKGSSYSDSQDRGSVTGENLANGVGVYGSTTSASGIGIKGSSPNTNPDQGSIYGINTGGGNGIYGRSHTGNGIAVGVKGYASGTFFGNGIGVLGIGEGAGYGVKGSINGSGSGIYGVAEASSGEYGRAAEFETWNTDATVEAVKVYNSGLAEALELVSANASNNGTMVRIRKWGTGDYMVLEDGSGNNFIRFSNSGKGFFNGGTQTGGADMAEAFDVTGDRNSYESGDVLVISTEKDRAVEKSSSSYSTLVAGVYATKPGVLMTEENIGTDISDKVPMGVLGVIPTKVCIEGGDIKRGDILVTSSVPGVAMKADLNKVKPGQIIGKALENFNSATIAKIKVLVNVK